MRKLAFIFILFALALAAISSPLLVQAQDETPHEQTQAALATTEFALGCRTIAVVSVNPGIEAGMNIRRQPASFGVSATPDNRVAKVFSTSGEIHAVQRITNGEGEWHRLCSLDDRWIFTGNRNWVAVATVTPTPIATRTPTHTPAPSQTATATPTRVTLPTGSVWICWRGVCNECPLPCDFQIRERP